MTPTLFIETFIKDLLDDPKAVERLNRCVRCDQIEKESFKCKACGCYLKFKVIIPISNCPLKKW